MSASRHRSVLAVQKATSLAELLALDDEVFVQSAYLTLFNRLPDPEGLGNYLEKLRSGVPKRQLVKDLRLSPEGTANAVALPGIQALLSLQVESPLASGRGPVASLSGLLALQDRAFVAAAYQLLLRRDADKSGMAAYLGRLRAGDRKLALLGDLRRCGESQALQRRLEQWRHYSESLSNGRVDAGMPLNSENSNAGGGVSIQTVIDELQALTDADFIHALYAGLLACKPDAAALKLSQSRLRSGASRQHLMAEIWNSDEANVLRLSLTAMDRAIKRAALADLPVVGVVFRRWMGLEGDGAQERLLRRLENQMAVMEALLRSQLPEEFSSGFDAESHYVDNPPEAQRDAGEVTTEPAIKPARSAAALLRTIPRDIAGKKEREHV